MTLYEQIKLFNICSRGQSPWSRFRPSNEPLASCISFNISDITIGLQHCFFLYCIFLQKFFSFQTNICAFMGSCISPIIASICMKHIEHTVITTLHTPPYTQLSQHFTPRRTHSYHNTSHPAVSLAEIS